MNIIFDINLVCSYSGNLMASIWELVEELKRRNVGVIYLFPYEARSIEWVEMLSHNEKVYYKGKNFIQKYLLYQTIIKNNKIDCVYSHFWQIDDSLIIKLLKLKNKRLKYIIHHHSSYHVSNSTIKEKVKHWILDADMHIGCGTVVVKQLEDARYKNVILNENCVSFSRLDKYEVIDWKFDENSMTLLIFSSCGFIIKGIDVAVKGVQLARSRGVNVCLLVCASINGNEIRRMIEKMFDDKLPDWIKVIPPREDVATLYKSVDAYLNSSRSEGLCYATVEAAYCKTQVIQSDIPQNRLDIPDTYIFQSENEKDLCRKIIDFSEDMKRGDQMKRENIYNYVLKHYSLKRWVQNEIVALESLI